MSFKNTFVIRLVRVIRNLIYKKNKKCKAEASLLRYATHNSSLRYAYNLALLALFSLLPI